MTKFFRIGAGLASAAALSLVATPALARDWGWGGHHRHRDRVDAGDIFAGVLILGGIAAIASAASKSKKDRERRAEDYNYPDDGRYQDRNDNPSYDNRPYDGRSDDNRPDWSESRGINDAIDRCASEVERGNKRIESVDSVNRDGDGWRVAGRMDGGKDFACTIDGDGRIRNVQMDGQAV